MTRDEAIQQVIDIAISQIGYHEKASNTSLDDPSTNSGSGNYTKYARDMDSLKDFYNSRKQGVAWCDIFVDWCFTKAFGANTGRKMLYQPLKSSGAGCTSSSNYFKKVNAFYDYPETGDQIFFVASDGNGFGHTGIVEKVASNKVYTIEGNSDDEVKRHSYSLTSAKIGGYGRPDWSMVEGKDDSPMDPLYFAIVTADNNYPVKMRNTATTNGKILAQVPQGSKVEVLEETNDTWAKISWQGITGYMMRKFLANSDEDDLDITEELENLRDQMVNMLETLDKILAHKDVG